MQKVLLIILIGFTILSCTVTEKPEFIEVKSLKIIDTSPKNFTLQADLLFLNNNIVGGVLQANDIHIFIDSIDVAILQSKLFTIPEKKEFIIPLQATIPFEKIFNDNKQNLLSNIMNVISKKKIQVTYKGKVRYEFGSFHYDYPLDYNQEVSLSK